MFWTNRKWQAAGDRICNRPIVDDMASRQIKRSMRQWIRCPRIEVTARSHRVCAHAATMLLQGLRAAILSAVMPGNSPTEDLGYQMGDRACKPGHPLLQKECRLGASRQSNRFWSQSSTSASTHPTRLGPRCTRLGNCPALSNRATCCGEYRTSSLS